MRGKFLKVFGVIATTLILITSCSSDDGDGGDSSSDCSTTITDQVAQGNFRGISFTSPGGTYRDISFDGEEDYICKIFVTAPIDNTSCVFPDFGTTTTDTLLFGLSSLEAQTFNVESDFDFGDNQPPTLNFNRIDDNQTTVELSCGVIIIDGLNASGQLTGSIVAIGVEGSSINGNFVLDLCDTSSF